MDFWGYPSDLCLFADNLQNPVTDKKEFQINNKTINILYSYFRFELIFISVTRYKYINKIQESNNKTLFLKYSSTNIGTNPESIVIKYVNFKFINP